MTSGLEAFLHAEDLADLLGREHRDEPRRRLPPRGIRKCPQRASVGMRLRCRRGAWNGVLVRPVRSILDRFRRGAAVPADPGSVLAAELAPLFAALDDLEEKAERLRADAGVRAARRVAAARDEAEGRAARDRELAEAERDDVARERRHAGAREARELQAAAEAEARRIAEAARRRMPALVAEVVSCVKEGPR